MKKGPSGEIDELDVGEDSFGYGGLSIIFHSEIITGGLALCDLHSVRLGHLQIQNKIIK